MRLIIFASGDLGIKTLENIQNDISIVYIFTDKKSSGIIDYSNRNSIPIFVGNPRTISNWSFLETVCFDWAFSINYLYIINIALINLLNNKIFNIHGSLLPKYRGRTPHVWAIINGEKECGITVHRIVEEVDAGDILIQRRIPIFKSDTGHSLLNKYAEMYPQMVLDSVNLLNTNTATFTKQNNSMATYFPKRVPEDGLVCWFWQKDRIVNWIRALTKPYPGAFSFCRGNKTYLWRSKITDSGFNYNTPNGSIVDKKGDAIFVKCPNGIVAIKEYEGIVDVNDLLEDN